MRELLTNINMNVQESIKHFTKFGGKAYLRGSKILVFCPRDKEGWLMSKRKFISYIRDYLDNRIGFDFECKTSLKNLRKLKKARKSIYEPHKHVYIKPEPPHLPSSYD